MTSEEAMVMISREYARAVQRRKPMNSAHEGYAVILEELDELWEEIRKKEARRNMDRMRKEAAQLGAMAVRFLVDVCR